MRFFPSLLALVLAVTPALATAAEGIESCDGADLIARKYERLIHDGHMKEAWTLLTAADLAAVDEDPTIADRDPTKFWKPSEWEISAHCLSLEGDIAVVLVHRLRDGGDYRIDHRMKREKGQWRVNWGYAHFEIASSALTEGARLESEDRHKEALAYYDRVLARIHESTQEWYELEDAAERLRKKIDSRGGLAKSKGYRSQVALSGLAHDKELETVTGFIKNNGHETLSRVVVQTVCKDGSHKEHEVVFVTSHDLGIGADLTYTRNPQFGRAMLPGEQRELHIGYTDPLYKLPCELDRVQVQDVDFTEETAEPEYIAVAKRARAEGIALKEYTRKNVRATATMTGTKVSLRVENRGDRAIKNMDLQLLCKPSSSTGMYSARPAYLPDEGIGPGGVREIDAPWVPAGCRQPTVRAKVTELD